MITSSFLLTQALPGARKFKGSICREVKPSWVAIGGQQVPGKGIVQGLAVSDLEWSPISTFCSPLRQRQIWRSPGSVAPQGVQNQIQEVSPLRWLFLAPHTFQHCVDDAGLSDEGNPLHAAIALWAAQPGAGAKGHFAAGEARRARPRRGRVTTSTPKTLSNSVAHGTQRRRTLWPFRSSS